MKATIFVALLLLLVAYLINSLLASPVGPRPKIPSNHQLRDIHQAMVNFAQNSSDHFPGLTHDNNTPNGKARSTRTPPSCATATPAATRPTTSVPSDTTQRRHLARRRVWNDNHVAFKPSHVLDNTQYGEGEPNEKDNLFVDDASGHDAMMVYESATQ